MPDQRMLAAIFEGEGKLVVREAPVPTIRTPQDVLVKVEVCGICGTDIRFLAVPPLIQAKKGVILGHEYTGQVIEVGEGVRQFQPGDRVAVIPDLPCGYCRFCAEGRPNLCENMASIGGDMDGGFAHYALAPAKGLYKISPDLPVEEGAFIELLSCVMGGVQKAALLPGEDVVIIGAGPAGLVYLKVFKAAGAGKVIMADISPWRIDFARQAGADLVINPREQNLAEAVRAVTSGGAHVVVDAVGSEVTAAMSVARKGGRIIVFGEDHRAECTIRPRDIQGRELQILGSFIGLHLFPQAVNMLEHKVVKLSGLISHRLSLAELPAGVAELAAGKGAKGVCFPYS
ncbi:MAG: alcohol dehydrogenase catalytic domain-containing protein [Chloroflexota bacterium]